MKSEHRHELKTNDLAKGLFTFQDYVKVYGGRIALGVLIAVLIVVLILQRRGKAREQERAMRDNLGYAREQIDRLSHGGAKPTQMTQARQALQEVLEKASDKAVLAEATVLQGELAWALATFPEVPGATTDRTWRPEKEPAELYKEAKEAYQRVISQYGDQPLPATTAHLGLAAIAESSSDWDEARKQYEAVKSAASVAPAFKEYADTKLRALEQIKQPVLVGIVPEKAEKPEPPLFPDLPPSTKRSATQSTTGTTPATGGTTAPIDAPKKPAPTTKPSAPVTGAGTKPAK
jgi:hypothetical protein